jgi:demethylmenaquinone methyltransferase / 2-methoxy-6-polyprenyl-1,4-benzoquinol methylase
MISGYRRRFDLRSPAPTFVMPTVFAPPPKNPSTSHEQKPLDKSGDRVREMFRQIAPRYDLMNHLLSMNVDTYWRRRAVSFLPTDASRNPDRRPLLDVCTGTGDLALSIAKKVPQGVEVIGSDFCNAMLKIARDKDEKRNDVPSVDFIEADSQYLPFDDQTFQAVSVAFGLRNVADTDKGLSEMTRVCAAGGRVLVLEFSRPRLPVLKQGYNAYFRHVLPRIGQWMANNDKSAYQYLPESVKEFPDYEQLAGRMTAAGLVNVQFRPLTLGVATIYWGDRPAV